MEQKDQTAWMGEQGEKNNKVEKEKRSAGDKVMPERKESKKGPL